MSTLPYILELSSFIWWYINCKRQVSQKMTRKLLPQVNLWIFSLFCKVGRKSVRKLANISSSAEFSWINFVFPKNWLLSASSIVTRLTLRLFSKHRLHQTYWNVRCVGCLCYNLSNCWVYPPCSMFSGLIFEARFCKYLIVLFEDIVRPLDIFPKDQALLDRPSQAHTYRNSWSSALFRPIYCFRLVMSFMADSR